MRSLLSLLPVAALALACATTPQVEPRSAQAPMAVDAETAPLPAPAELLPSQVAPTVQPAQAAGDASRVLRPGYSFPVPAGWQEVLHPSVADLNAAGGAIISRPAATQGWFTPSVVVAPVPPGALPTKELADCRAIADAVAELTQTRVEHAGLITLPSTGSSCQFDLTSSIDENRRGRGTVLVGESPWTMTCNYDARDGEALPACDAVVQGFRFSGELT